MKKNSSSIIAVISCILLVICLFEIILLKYQIQSMQTNLTNRISELRVDMDNITANVSAVLEEEASFLSLAEWSYGTFDAESKKVEILCKISPKEYSSETTAAIVYDNQEYPLAFENGMYTGAVEIPVFEEVHLELVRFKDGDAVRTQNLDWYINARNEYLPMIYAQFSGTEEYSIGDDMTTVSYDGEILVEGIQKGDYSDIKEINLVEYIDDKEISKRKINYENASESSWYEWKQEVEIPFGSTYKAYVETVDQYDLHYYNLIELAEIDETGQCFSDWGWWQGAEADIYDADGNPLFVKEVE